MGVSSRRRAGLCGFFASLLARKAGSKRSATPSFEFIFRERSPRGLVDVIWKSKHGFLWIHCRGIMSLSSDSQVSGAHLDTGQIQKICRLMVLLGLLRRQGKHGNAVQW